jgi:16S rRNA (guanine527-N7)-methyltransferase
VTEPPPTPVGDPLGDGRLHEVLAQAQDLGYLGAAPVLAHLLHSTAFLPRIGPEDRVADLGSGAGLPGLVIAVARPGATVLLVEVSERRADHLRRAVAALELGDRVEVEQRPAEQVGRDPRWRGTLSVVTARGFGPPAVVAECAAPLLGPGGQLIVSEPPASDGARWDGLATTDLPFGPVTIDAAGDATVAVLALTDACPARYPRAAGTPARRPLF